MRVIITPAIPSDSLPREAWEVADGFASTLAASNRLGRISGETVTKAGRKLHRFDVLDNGVASSHLVVIDRVPDQSRGSYDKSTDRTPQDKGGRSLSKGKSRSPIPFTRHAGQGAPALAGSDGIVREALVPKGGAYCTKGDRKAAAYDLARQGLYPGCGNVPPERLYDNAPAPMTRLQTARLQDTRPDAIIAQREAREMTDAEVTARANKVVQPGGAEWAPGATVKRRQHTVTRHLLAS